MKVTKKEKVALEQTFEVGDVLDLGDNDFRLVIKDGDNYKTVDLKTKTVAWSSSNLQQLKSFYNEMPYTVHTLAEIVLEEK